MDNRRLLSPTGTSLEPLEKKIYQGLKNLCPGFKNATLIVGVSGGIDSVVLLRVLHALTPRFRWKLHVVHVNHGIRGKEADSDSLFVRHLAKELKLQHTQKKLRDMKKKSSENLLRQRRYEALFELKKKFNGSYVVTAHHRDDLLETRLMRLLQGTGIHGLTAMTMLSSQGLLRPFIGISRREIEEYAGKNQLRWRNDATNEDTTKLRNWIRRNWLSPLRSDHPGYLDNLFQSLERLIPIEKIPAGQSDVSADMSADKSAGKSSKSFDRQSILSESNLKIDELVYNYLRHNAKDRVTSRHVAEFKKKN